MHNLLAVSRPVLVGMSALIWIEVSKCRLGERKCGKRIRKTPMSVVKEEMSSCVILEEKYTLIAYDFILKLCPCMC